MKLMERIRRRRETWRRLGLLVLTLFVLIHGYGLVLKFMPVPWTMNMSHQAKTIPVQYDWVPLEEISPYLAYAVIGAEDSGFCDHHGIDWQAVEKVLEEREAGKSQRGGSTITQQVAKNVYLWNGGGWFRKLPETWLALYIDTIWSKRRIMEVYLNVAEWGDGIYGAEAAAQARFLKSAKDLTAHEAALLAAVLPSPNKWRVDPPGDYVARRSQTLKSRTADVKWGGYGQCIGVDESQMYFPARKKEEDSQPSEETKPPVKEDFETLLDDIEETLKEDREEIIEAPIDETVDETPPERL